jgi:hypothetical protein
MIFRRIKYLAAKPEPTFIHLQSKATKVKGQVGGRWK